MKPTICCAIVVALWLHPAALAQQRPQPATTLQRRQAMPAQPRQAQPVQNVYQRRDTWYEFLLKQFNPGDIDYGALIEQRRQAFLEAYAHNPYFGYSLGTTILIVLLLSVSIKQRIDYLSSQWMTAEMMADLYNHDQYSRQVAKAAIKRYNDHIERCNRAIEAGRNSPFADDTAEVDRLQAALQKKAGEVQQLATEKAGLQEEVRQKSNMIVQMSMRLDALASRSAGQAAATQPIDLQGSDANLLNLVNSLQEQLYAEQEKNKHLKGA